MKIKKLVSILLTALLLTQIFNFSALAATEEPENIVQTAVSEYLATIGEDALTDENVYDTYNAKGVLLKNQTGLFYSKALPLKAIDGINNDTDNYMCGSTTNSGIGTKYPQIALNLQKARSFNKIVFYEWEKGTSAVSGVTPPTSRIKEGTIKLAVADSYTDNGTAVTRADFLDVKVKDTSVFGNYKALDADEYTYTIEPVGDYANGVLKHTIVLNEIQNSQFFIFQHAYVKGSPTRIMELELYHETKIGEVSVTEADGTVTAAVSGSGLTSEYADMVLILAEYEGSVLENVNLGKIEAITAGNATITVPLTKVSGRTYKAFLFKSMDTLIPLQAAEPLEN